MPPANPSPTLSTLRPWSPTLPMRPGWAGDVWPAPSLVGCGRGCSRTGSLVWLPRPGSGRSCRCLLMLTLLGAIGYFNGVLGPTNVKRLHDDVLHAAPDCSPRAP